MCWKLPSHLHTPRTPQYTHTNHINPEQVGFLSGLFQSIRDYLAETKLLELTGGQRYCAAAKMEGQW